MAAPPPRNVTMKLHATPQRHVYEPEDFESNNGMLTTIWGPATWHLLHCISFNYPTHPTDVQKQQYRQFVLSLKNVIPCGKCRKNLTKNFAVLPLEDRHMASRDTFSRYIYDLHEVVNRMLHKTSGLSYESVRNTYEHFRARCASTTNPSKSTTMAKGGVAGSIAGSKAGSKTGSKRTTQKRNSSEKGCVVPFNGKKTKCVLRIVPQSNKCKTFSM